MRIVLRKRKTFEAYKLIECGTYNYALDIDGRGSFTVPELIYGCEGDILCIHEGRKAAFVINALTRKDGATTISTMSVLKLYDAWVRVINPVEYYNNGELGYIKAISDWRITSNSAGDHYTDIPWLSVAVSGNGTKAAPSRLEDSGYFNFLDYVKERLEARTISFDYVLSNTGITFRFREYSDEAHIYDLTTGRYQLISDSSSYNVVSKIITSTKGTAGTWSEKAWYFFADGTFSDNPNDGDRVDGSMKHINNPKETTVADTFASNEYKENINVYVDEIPSEFVYCHPVIIKLPDSRIVKTVITGITVNSNDPRYNITTGNAIKSRNEFIRKAYAMASNATSDINAIRG